jgi:hypothetical protein
LVGQLELSYKRVTEINHVLILLEKEALQQHLLSELHRIGENYNNIHHLIKHCSSFLDQFNPYLMEFFSEQVAKELIQRHNDLRQLINQISSTLKQITHATPIFIRRHRLQEFIKRKGSKVRFRRRNKAIPTLFLSDQRGLGGNAA